MLYYYNVINGGAVAGTAGLMAEHFGESCDEIMALVLLYMVNIIPIGYGTIHIDMIIFETPHTKYNMFNSVHHPPHA